MMEIQNSASWIRELDVHCLKEIKSVNRLNLLLKTTRFSMLLVDSGTIEFVVEQKHVSVSTGQFYVIPYTARAESITGKLRICVVTCSTAFAYNSAISKFGSGYIDFVLIHRGTLLNLEAAQQKQMLLIIELLRQKVSFQNRTAMHDEIVVLCFNLLLYEFGLLQYQLDGGYTMHRSRKEILVINFIGVLKQHCSLQHSVKFYADQLFVSAGYLSKAIREVTGMSAKHFIEMAILSEAYLLLANENLTISEISTALNFSDSSTFSNFFKRYGKMSPTHYRLTLRNFVQQHPEK
jgi:AraC family transcriptional activator of pobA